MRVFFSSLFVFRHSGCWGVVGIGMVAAVAAVAVSFGDGMGWDGSASWWVFLWMEADEWCGVMFCRRARKSIRRCTASGS